MLMNTIKTKIISLMAVAAMAAAILLSPVNALAMAPDTSEETEKTEAAEPLTPSGNMSLVDDYGNKDSSGKQFITVTTRNGNYFYIIIDRDDEGSEKVHFLNMVDESDLLSLMAEDEVNDYIAITSGKAKEDGEKEIIKTPVSADTAEAKAESEDKKMTGKGSKVSGIMALIMILAIAGAGAFMYFKSTKKSRRDVTSDPDEDYTENIDESFLEDMNNENIRNAEDEIDERFDTEEN